MADSSAFLSPADDFPHPVLVDHRFWHETWWFWFFNAERKFGGWLYNYIRPNIGVSGGGCFVWDDTTWNHMEVPYYASYAAQPMPQVTDHSVEFASRTVVEIKEPLHRFHLSHTDRDWIDVDLDWTGVMDPWLNFEGQPPRLRHLDHVGHVVGTVTVHGDAIPIDCLAIRDRTWAPRQERWKDGGGQGYTNAAADEGRLAFLHGRYLIIDGEGSPLESTRTVERDPEHGFLTRVSVEGIDERGRRLEAVGVPVSRMAMPIPGVHAVVWTSLLHWTVNGVDAWGEDQEPWPLNQWAELRRRQRAGTWVDEPRRRGERN
jgi:hypothetical protein